MCAASAKRVVVAMSGGVDSSVAAALLVRQGHLVTGMMLRLWSESGREADNRCCTPDAMAQARRVAAILGIPFYAVDARQPFHDAVVQGWVDGYLQGDTPNPCLICNRSIRFGLLQQQALALGAEFLATGHYARLEHADGAPARLFQGRDAHKDQSYVLHVLNQAQLAHTLLPLGEFTKPEIRQMARDFGLPVAERPDSQDLCFLAGQDYREVLQRLAPESAAPGPVVTRDGRTLGEHQGLAFYTIGQRKGLGVASPQPLYVLGKDPGRNALVVGTGDELGGSRFETGPVNWISAAPPDGPQPLQVKIRYKAALAPAQVTPLADGRARVICDPPLRDITPGQAAVFYNGEECLGGGIILKQGEIE